MQEISLVFSDALPPADTVTAAFALAFEGELLLLTNLAARGWDIPGGHLDPGETPEETMRREVYEETGARLGPARLLGYQRRHVAAPKPDNYPFPYPDSYLVYYLACVESLDKFVPNEEALERGLLAPSEVEQVPWVRSHRALYEAARTEVTRSTTGGQR